MSNPFKSQFDSSCQSCGNEVFEGDEMYAIDGQFVCEECADSNGNVCECGNYKKEEFDKCYECYEEEKDMEGDSINENNHD